MRPRIQNPQSKIQNRAAVRLLGAFLPCCLLALASPALGGQPMLEKIEINGGLSWPEQGLPHTYACGERWLRVISAGVTPWDMGSGTIESGCTVRVFMDGAPDIDVLWTHVDFYGPGQWVDCQLDVLDGQPSGVYSVEVINPGGESAILWDVLEVDGTCPRGRAGDLYVMSQFGRNDQAIDRPQRGFGTPCPYDDPDTFGCLVNYSGNVIQYDGQTGEFVCVFASGREATWDFSDIAWGPNGNLFVAGMEQSGSWAGYGRIVEYDGQTGEYVRTFVQPYSGSMYGPQSLAFGGPNANLYVLTNPGSSNPGFQRDSIIEFDGRTGAYIPNPGVGDLHSYGPLFHPFEDYNIPDAKYIRFGPAGNLVVASDGVCASDEPAISVIDPLTGELLRVLAWHPGGPDCIGYCGFVYERATNTLLAVFNAFDRVDRFDFAAGGLLETLIDIDGGGPGNADQMWDLAWGPTGNLFVCAKFTTTYLPNVECYSPGCESGISPQKLGAMHEYDGATYEQVRVFGYAHDRETEWNFKPRSHELFNPVSISYKPLPGDWGGDTAGGDFVVDMWDFDRFVEAYYGTSNNKANDLIAFDADRDGDIDCDDWPAFLDAWALHGQGAPPDFPGCAGYTPDPDGDGVHFDEDVCPDTPAWVMVDAMGRPLGDLDGDCDVDMADFSLYQENMTGPLSSDGSGACCLPDATCAVLTAGECAASHGVYRGNNTTCDEPCPTGACCFGDGSCVDDMPAAACLLAGGSWQGDGSDCATAGCPPPGACCLSDGSCIERTETACLAEGGSYRGDWTECATTECPYGEYSNEIDVISYYAPAGDGLQVAEDISLEGTGARELVYLDLSVGNTDGLGAFDVTVTLYTDCPGYGGTAIPGTTFTWYGVPGNAYAVYTLVADEIDPPVTIPDTVWMVATFSRPNNGWIAADEAEIGYTDDVFGLNDNPWVCNYIFENHDPYAGLWANLHCVEGVNKSATDTGRTSSRLSVERVAAPVELWQAKAVEGR